MRRPGWRSTIFAPARASSLCGSRTAVARRVRADGDLIAVDWPIMPFADVDRLEALEQSLGRRPESTFEADFGVIAVFASEEEVRELAPDLQRIAALEANTVIVTAAASRSDFVIRVFAPKLGLPEDPVCGTAHRIIVPFWAKRLGRTSLVSHQVSARRGELFCELRGDVVTIAGLAVPFLEGVIRLRGMKDLSGCQQRGER